jgi:hypothetical protein
MTKPILTTFSPVEIPSIHRYKKYLPTAFDESLSILQKLNKVIKSLEALGEVSTDVVAQWNTLMQWIEDSGLEESATTVLNEMIADGTIGDLINNGLLNNLITQLGAKATQADLNVLQAQISTLIASAGNPEATSAEILDSHITSYNETWDTLGNRLRGNDDFNSYTRSMASYYHAIQPVKDSNSYVDKNTLVLTPHSGYVLTKMVDCQYNDEFLVTTVLSGILVPFAVFYDENKNIVGVSSVSGISGDTSTRTALIRVNKTNAKYVAFQCTSSTQAQLMVRKKKSSIDSIETLKRTRGYYHVKAKNRSAMSDRAQAWLTYDVGAGATVNSFNIPFDIASNVSGVNYRLFAGLTPTTYEMVLENYSSWQGEGTYNWITTGKSFLMPNDDTTGAPTRYFHVFIDIILTDVTKDGEIYIPKFKVNGKEPIRAILNLPGSTTDRWADVPPFAEHSPLYKKTMAILGTSLSYGSISGNDVTWFNKLGKKYDMTYYNFGDNGDTVANQTTESQPCMVNRWNTIPTGLDYFILEGGANDLRLGVPLGDVNSTDPNTFMGAINVILNGIRSANPKVKILCLTNWNRTSSTYVNSIGKTNLDYVNAMIEVANAQGVQVIDNYHNSGLNFFNSVTNVWQDEGIVVNGSANYHISDEAYTWLLPKYEQAMRSL